MLYYIIQGYKSVIPQILKGQLVLFVKQINSFSLPHFKIHYVQPCNLFIITKMVNAYFVMLHTVIWLCAVVCLTQFSNLGLLKCQTEHKQFNTKFCHKYNQNTTVFYSVVLNFYFTFMYIYHTWKESDCFENCSLKSTTQYFLNCIYHIILFNLWLSGLPTKCSIGCWLHQIFTLRCYFDYRILIKMNKT